MFTSECLGVENGHLTIGGCDTVELANQFGTPLYVMDEQTVRNNCRMFKKSIDDNYESGLVLFASKALNCLQMCRIAKEEGLGLDCVSGGEIYTALKAGFPADKIYFHGNNKTTDEMIYAIENKIGTIIVDNHFELEELNELAKKRNVTVDIMFRIKPGIDAHTHDFIRTGQIDSKFGFALENGEAFDAVKATKDMSNVNLIGLHCHIGSQIFMDTPFIEAAKVMMNFYKKIKDELEMELKVLNLGGGFAIKYLESDEHFAYEMYMKEVASVIKDFCLENNLSVPMILIEPGRSIVGAAGITLYKVGAVKEIKNVRNYVSIDGGMGDNPRYALYQSDYEVIVANKADKPRDYVATIAGKCCESGDLIQENTKIATPCKGDTVAVLSTGAYNYSMASNYNRIPRPEMIMINDKKPYTIIKRETYEDIVRNDI
ncbi:MAG: diaminopimelate decarboxylase [Acutalibacteraceae bacterium]|nr:diaminopimelate decarboxylase [Acutalibacteraceae bacterium]